MLRFAFIRSRERTTTEKKVKVNSSTGSSTTTPSMAKHKTFSLRENSFSHYKMPGEIVKNDANEPNLNEK